MSFISAGETNPQKIFQTESPSCPLHPEACKRIQSLAMILTVRSSSEEDTISIVLGTSGFVCLNATVIQWIIKINVDRFLLFATTYIFPAKTGLEGTVLRTGYLCLSVWLHGVILRDVVLLRLQHLAPNPL